MDNTVPCADALAKAKHELSLILKHAGEGIYGLDRDGKTTFVNYAAANMVDLTLEQMKGKCNHALVHHHRKDGSVYNKEDCPIYATLQDGVARHGEDEHFMRSGGTFFPIEYFVNPIIENDEITGAVVTFIDITQRKKRQQQLDEYKNKLEKMVEEKTQELAAANEELLKISLQDALTGIANRRAFDLCLSEEIRRAARVNEPLTLILGDVDHFKKYNDTYGHHGGDQCLKQIAQTIQKTFQRAGELVARYGGEEFAIVVPTMDIDHIKYQINQLLENIKNLNITHKNSGCSNVISMSFGIAHFIPNGDDLKNMIIRADDALYAAKLAGRNQYVIAK